MVKTPISSAMGVGKSRKASELRRKLRGVPSAILVDPLGFDAGDSNLYRYVNNAPTGAMDPSGLDTRSGPANNRGVVDKNFGGPNDDRKADHVFISVEEEKKAGPFKGGDRKVVPISIQLTAAGAKPFVARNNSYLGSHVLQKEGEINPNPWRNLGPAGREDSVKVGQHFGGYIMLEYVITFSGNPRSCTWGRNVVNDKDFKFISRTGEAIITHSEGKRSNVVRDDYPYPDAYIVGNKVYMYDAPGGPFRTSQRLFEVWAESADGTKRISNWYYVDTGIEARKIQSPTFWIRNPWPANVPIGTGWPEGFAN